MSVVPVSTGTETDRQTARHTTIETDPGESFCSGLKDPFSDVICLSIGHYGLPFGGELFCLLKLLSGRLYVEATNRVK